MARGRLHVLGVAAAVAILAQARKFDAISAEAIVSNKMTSRPVEHDGSGSSRGFGLLEEEPQNVVQRVLYKYGSLYARWTVQLSVLGILILIFCLAGLPMVQKNDSEFGRQWSKAGGRLEKELDYVDQHHQKQWEVVDNRLLVVHKDNEDGEGSNVLTSHGLEELHKLYEIFYSTQVTTRSNKTFSAHDLCARGSLPDRPADQTKCQQLAGLQRLCAQNQSLPQCHPSALHRASLGLALLCNRGPYMPCQIIGPLDCFREAGDHHDPVFRTLYDPNIHLIPSFAPLLPLSYQGRPSFRNKTSHELLRIVAQTPHQPSMSPGCNWWTKLAVYPPPIFLGGVDRNGVDAFFINFRMEAPERVRFRLAVTKPQLAYTQEIEEALRLFSFKWEELSNKHGEKFSHIKAYAVGTESFDEITDRMLEIPAIQIIATVIAMMVFVGILFGSWTKPLGSRLCVSLLGLALVLICMMASAGLCGWVGLRFSPTMFQALPFFAIGMGVDDMFVLLCCFNDIGTSTLRSSSGQQVMATVMGRAGTSVILSSLCNTAAFCCCMLLGVPGITDFGKGGAIIMAVNLVAAMMIFPGILLLEALRLRRLKGEFLLFACHRRRLSDQGPLTGDEPDTHCWIVSKRLIRFVAKNVTRPSIKFSITIVALILLAICFILALNMDAGYNVHELITTDSPVHEAYKILFQYFGTYPGRLVGKDLDYPGQQQQLLELQHKVLMTSHAQRGTGSSWLTAFYQAVPDSALNNSTYTHPTLAPRGIMSADPSIFYDLLRRWYTIPTDPLVAMRGGSYVTADLTGINEFGRHDMSQNLSAQNPFTLTFADFWMTGLVAPRDFVVSIRDIRKVISDSGLSDKVFPYGTIFTYWEIFQSLSELYWIALGSSLASVWIITMLLLNSWRAASVATLTSAVITLEIYGINALHLQFNIFVCISLLLAVALSIEFTVHTLTAFEYHAGTVSERLAKAMETSLPPVFLGAASTLLCIIPIAFSTIPFLRLYLFTTTAVVLVIGTLNASIVLPTFLSLFGCDVITALGEDEGKNRDMPPVTDIGKMQQECPGEPTNNVEQSNTNMEAVI